MTQYAIYPMDVINISQRYKSTHLAWDICGTSTSPASWKAPCNLRLLKTYSFGRQENYYESGHEIGPYNTAMFGTCDATGNKAPVMCEDGQMRVLTFALTHMNGSDFAAFGFNTFVYEETDPVVYTQGTVCYKEGICGWFSNGSRIQQHIHMEVAEGWQFSKYTGSGGQFIMHENINPCDVFTRYAYQSAGGSNGTNGYTFKIVSSGSYPASTTPLVKLHTSSHTAALRKLPSTGAAYHLIIPTYSEADILSFRKGFESDGYQWAFVKYTTGGNQVYYGYVQLDPNGYTFLSANESYHYNTTPLFLINPSQSRQPAIRTSAITGTPQYTLAYESADSTHHYRIMEFLPGFESDGYQWVHVIKDNETAVNGYVQLDLMNWVYISANIQVS